MKNNSSNGVMNSSSKNSSIVLDEIFIDRKTLIQKKYKENIEPLLSKAFKEEQKYSYFPLFDYYSEIYMSITLEQLLYLHEDSVKFKIFDEMLYKTILYSLYKGEFSFAGDQTYNALYHALQILNEYDRTMPFNWFVELRSDDFNLAFNKIIMD